MPENRTCPVCAEPIRGNPHKTYCSHACYVVARWGHIRTPYTGREEARRLYPLAGQTCARCAAPAAVHHHRDENPLNNAPANIELLCRACHARHHDSPITHKRTHCKRGHPLEGWNVYVRPNGARQCRTCLNARNRARYHRP